MDLTWLVVLVAVVVTAVVAFVMGRKSRPLPPGDRGQEALPEGRGPEPSPTPGLGQRPGTGPAVPVPTSEPPSDGLFRRLVQGLSKTQSHLVDRLDAAFRGRKEIDAALYDELETILVSADVGVRTASKLLTGLRSRVDRQALKDPVALREYLKEDILDILRAGDAGLARVETTPLVILIVGVNGTGKTTTIGKLASRFKLEGKKVLLAAGDTFRAAAIEQLEVWAERAQVDLIKNKEGTDPASVIFDALQAAKARGSDVVIADTAGRLHTKVNLMDELKKVHRAIGKVIPGAPHEVLLVLDATMGQNALIQARTFHEGTHLTGIVLTKLDGTAKGGIVIAIVGELGLPVKFIGVGEKLEDLQPFDAERFVSALF